MGKRFYYSNFLIIAEIFSDQNIKIQPTAFYTMYSPTGNRANSVRIKHSCYHR